MQRIGILWWTAACLAAAGCPGAAGAERTRPRPAALGYRLQPVPVGAVTLRGFWARRLRTHIDVTIPHVLKTLRIDYGDPVPSISQLALVRTLEGVAWCLMIEPNAPLEGMMDRICARIGRMCEEGDRFLPACPDAPTRYYLATGKATAWLKAAEREYRRRREEYFDANWAPQKEPPPHGGIEMSLVSLYEATGNAFYRTLAERFMLSRGMPATRQRLWPKFAAQHRPIEQMDAPGGHAGSFGWFAASLVDVAAMTGGAKYRQAAERIWRNLLDTRMCITGGCGAVSRWEGFGEPYAIGRGGYNETCAASGEVFYNVRLGWLTGEGRYFDTMEVVLFNGLLAGVSLAGDSFFYTNVLESHGGIGRRPSRRVPCCHGSICRTIPQVPGCLYAHTDRDLYVTLYAAGSVDVPLAGGRVSVEQETDYPFDGRVVLRIRPGRAGQRFALRLRIPTWTGQRFLPGALYRFVRPPARRWALFVNGRAVEAPVEAGFAALERAWQAGDTVRLELPMDVRFSTCIEKVAAYRGRVAVTRGPLVYCAEEADNAGRVQRLSLPAVPKPGQVRVAPIADGPLAGLPRIELPAGENVEGGLRAATLRLVPYFAWANRGEKSMMVWVPLGRPERADPLKWVPLTAGAKPPRSRGGDSTAVLFENRSARRVKLYWVGYRGVLKAYAEIAPGGKHTQNTYANNTWLIADENDRPLGYFVAGPQAARAVIPE